MTDQEILEEEVERALQVLRSTDPVSPHHRERYKKRLNNSVHSLKEEFPDSYVLRPEFDRSY